jgi:NADH-quinone oxidoreductase subunit M
VAAFVEDRTGRRDLGTVGGLFAVTPKLAGAGVVFALIALGVPGSGNFISEILVVIGTFAEHPLIAILSATGMIFSVIYSLWIIQKFFHGEHDPRTVDPEARLVDLRGLDIAVPLVMIVAVFWIGIYPQPIIHIVGSLLQSIAGGIS